MKFVLSVLALVVAVWADPEFKIIEGGLSGDGVTTHYWDCCKPSCAWIENVDPDGDIAVASCAKDGVKTLNASIKSGCDGGPSYMCNNQQPWKVSDTLAYGFTAASFSGGVDVNNCCACLKLDFTDQIVGKSFVVQITNTGGDLGQNHFDLALPGGGVGIFTQGCHDQWNAPWSGWGDQYGGVHTRQDCLSLLPKELQPGCLFRFDFLENANNPKVKFQEVECPAELIKISGCKK